MGYGVRGLSDGFLAGFGTMNQFYANERENERANKRLEMDQQRQQMDTEIHKQNVESNNHKLWQQERENSRTYVTDWMNNAALSENIPEPSYELMYHMNKMGVDNSSLLPEENAKYMTTAQNLVNNKISYQSPEAIDLAKSLYQKELNSDLVKKGMNGYREITGIVPTAEGTFALEISRYEDGKLVSEQAPVSDQGLINGNDNVVLFEPDKAMKRLLGRSALSRELFEKNPELQKAWRARIDSLRTNRKEKFGDIIQDPNTGMLYQVNQITKEVKVLQNASKGSKASKGYKFFTDENGNLVARGNLDTGAVDYNNTNTNLFEPRGTGMMTDQIRASIASVADTISLTPSDQATYTTEADRAAFKQYRAAQMHDQQYGTNFAAALGFKEKPKVGIIDRFKAAEEVMEGRRKEYLRQHPTHSNLSDWELNKLLFKHNGENLENKFPGISKYKDRLTAVPSRVQSSSQRPDSIPNVSDDTVINTLQEFKQAISQPNFTFTGDEKARSKLARISQLDQIISTPRPEADAGLFGSARMQKWVMERASAIKELKEIMHEFGMLKSESEGNGASHGRGLGITSYRY